MKLDNICNAYVDMMFSLFLEQHITLPTRVAGNSEKLIDHIWTNCSSTVQSGVFDSGISDHHITFAFIPSCIERKITHEKFREKSENRLEHLQFSRTIILFYMKHSKRDWMNALNSMKSFRFANMYYEN